MTKGVCVYQCLSPITIRQLVLVFIHFVLFLFFNAILFIISASFTTKYKIPTDLKVRYERLSSAAVGNKFFLPAEMASTGSRQPRLNDGDKFCPKSLSTDIILERSTCPWYLTTTHDSTVFPPSRTEVVCRYGHCLDLDNNHQCVTVYNKMSVLKRTGECVDGLYVYKPSVIEVATACVCARTLHNINGRNESQCATKNGPI
uniref:Interleukin 17-like protein n=1 Tax=Octopus bimaculoides TaxID=37653 RepID=A0A0L8HVF5_OCTBM